MAVHFVPPKKILLQPQKQKYVWKVNLNGLSDKIEMDYNNENIIMKVVMSLLAL